MYTLLSNSVRGTCMWPYVIGSTAPADEWECWCPAVALSPTVTCSCIRKQQLQSVTYRSPYLPAGRKMIQYRVSLSLSCNKEAPTVRASFKCNFILGIGTFMACGCKEKLVSNKCLLTISTCCSFLQSCMINPMYLHV